VAFAQTHLHRLGYAPLITDVTAELGLTYAAAGAIQTAYFWTYTVVQLPIGLVVDRWGVRRVMLACMGLLTLGALAFALSGGYGTAIVARMLVGVGAAAVWVPGLRLISEWFPPAERGRATGIMGAGAGIGGTIGLVVVPWVAASCGWRWAYALTALPALVTVALIAALLPESRGGRAAPIRDPGGLRRVLASRSLWPFTITVSLAYGAYFSFVTFLPAFLVRGMGMTSPQAGLVTGLITAGTIASWPLAGVVSDGLGRRKPVYLASQVAGVATCIAFALVVPGLGTMGAMATALVAGLLTGGIIIPFVMITELFPPELAGTASGVTNTAAFVGGMVLPIVLGRVVDVTGSFGAAFLLAAGVHALALASGLFVVETGRRA
jgi:predicted MFS family arabinose efflux permease